MDKKQLGWFGEDIACDYLKNNGYRILDRNYVKEWDDKTKGEIDIVAKKNNVIVFVEVKTQEVYSGVGEEFFPEDKVNYKKQRKLIKLAQSWLLKNKVPLDSAWQIDVVSVVIDIKTKKAKIRHFKNAVCEY